jgi:hypothetical protein
MLDCLLGGDGHRAVDRAAVEKIRAAVPDVAAGAWANRIFCHRAAIWMTGQPIAYVTRQDPAGVIPISTVTNTAGKPIDTGQGPFAIVIIP